MTVTKRGRAMGLLLIALLLPITWVRAPSPQEGVGATLRFIPLRLPPSARLAPHLGAFRLDGAWEMTSERAGFGGYSALVPLGDGQLLAVSDRASFLRFSPPGAARRPAGFVPRPDPVAWLPDPDAEAATRDPVTGTVWIAREGSNRITRHAGGRIEFPAGVRPLAMQGWDDNAGPEAMVRLADGRFIVLAEAFTGTLDSRGHRALLFRGDPVIAGEPEVFAMAGPGGFSPTDMAQMPDGRVLIVMRRLVWLLPLRFAGRIVIADPAEIRAGQAWRTTEVAKLTSSLPVDNFEGIAIEPRPDGKVTVWLISDDNGAITQRTLLWKLSVDPAALPRAGTPQGAEPRPAP